MTPTFISRRGLLLLGALATGLALAPATRAGTYSVWAGPNVFGPWVQVASHASAITYKISAIPVGNTAIVGEVMYFGVDGQRKIESFHRQITIRTCPCVGVVQVRFKGIPFGSAVDVNVNP